MTASTSPAGAGPVSDAAKTPGQVVHDAFWCVPMGKILWEHQPQGVRDRWENAAAALAPPATVVPESVQRLEEAALEGECTAPRYADSEGGAYLMLGDHQIAVSVSEEEADFIAAAVNFVRTLLATPSGRADTPPAGGGVVEALRGISDDYMTSERHHPGYVLIPAAKFEQLRAASEALPPAPQCGAYPECGCYAEGKRSPAAPEPATTIPPGYWFAPDELTQEMLDEADRACALPESFLRKVYAAWRVTAPEPAAGGEREIADPELSVLADTASASEQAYGTLWRLTAFDESCTGYAHDARKVLLASMDKEGQRRGIAWATRRYGPLGPNPRFMLSDEDRMEMGL